MCKFVPNTKAIDRTGQKFGRLTFVEYIGRDRYKTLWKFKCDCGNDYIGDAKAVSSGNTSSCGCYSKESLIKRNQKHGLWKSPLYQKYQDMIRRCYNPDTTRFNDYGGKGVEVCKEWLKENNGFENFVNWSLNNGYVEYDPKKTPRKEVPTLDRIDNSKGYSPDNCRWVKFKKQENNKSNNLYLFYKNEKFTTKELAEKFDISYTIVKRKYHKGMSGDDIVIRYSRLPENYDNRGRLGTLPNYEQRKYNLQHNLT